MPNLPANIEAFCKVVDWRGFSTLLAGDADGIPDFTIIPGLTVTFTLNADSVKDVTASPSQGLALAVKPVSFIYDSDGYLVGANGVRGGYLIPTDDPDLNPTGMTYRVSWTVNGAPVIGPTGGVAFRTFDMAAPAGTTQDLVKLAPVPSSTGVSLNQAQAAEAAAVSAASQATAAASAAIAAAATFVPATVDTLGQATTVGKSIAKATSATAARVSINAVGKGELVIDIRDAPYNADPTGVIDATAAIQAAFAAAEALIVAAPAGGSKPCPKVIGLGQFRVSSTITIKTACDLSGALFNSYQTTGVVIQVGDQTATTFATEFKLPQVLSKIKTVVGWSQVAGTVGVRTTNLWGCWVHVPYLRGFETNLWGHANGTTGSGYNKFYLGWIFNGQSNIKLSPTAPGWFNRNDFIGGILQHNLAEKAAGITHVVIEAAEDNAFTGTSIESAGIVQYHLDCAGQSNVFDNCRWENDEPYPEVIWRAASGLNVIKGGVGSERIVFTTETGAKNPGPATPLTAYTTTNIPASLGVGGLAMDSTLQRPVFSADGVTAKPMPLQEDLPLTGEGPPEGVVSARAGQIYSRTDLGVRTNLCKYPIGASVSATTGWKSATLNGAVTLGSGYLRQTITSGGQASIYQSAFTTHPVTVGTRYTIQMQVRSSASAQLRLNIRFMDSAGALLGVPAYGAYTTTNATTFVDIGAVTAISPSNAAYLQIRVDLDAGGTAGDTFDFRRVMWEQSAAPGGYFDGSMSGAGVTYAWTGTANISTSTATYTLRPVSYVKTGSGSVGWLAIAPGGGVAVPANATDAASTQTLVNALKAALVASGIVV